MDQIVLRVELAAPIARAGRLIGGTPMSGQALSFLEDQVERCRSGWSLHALGEQR